MLDREDFRKTWKKWVVSNQFNSVGMIVMTL